MLLTLAIFLYLWLYYLCMTILTFIICFTTDGQYDHYWFFGYHHSVQFSSVTQSCPTLCDPMNCSTPGLPVHQQLPEITQACVHLVSDAIQPSHPLKSLMIPILPNPSNSFLSSLVFLGQSESFYTVELYLHSLWQCSTPPLTSLITPVFPPPSELCSFSLYFGPRLSELGLVSPFILLLELPECPWAP